MALITIDDDNYGLYVPKPEDKGKIIIDGQVQSTGLIYRDPIAFPTGYGAAAKFNMDIIPRNEWRERLAEKKAKRADLYYIRNKGAFGQMIPSRNQGSKGYCWAHSTVSAAILIRAYNNMVYADLSAYAIACEIKNFQDQGGWNTQSLGYMKEKGCPTSKTWEQQSMKRSNINPEMRAEALQYRVTEWLDFDMDRESIKDQLVTCLLLDIPVAVDFNWWGHSVCACRLVNIFDDWSIEITIWNSWGNTWSDNGMGNLKGSKAIPNGASCPRVLVAADGQPVHSLAV